MSFIIIIALIIAITSMLVIIANRKFEEMLPISIFGIIIILYVFGLVGILRSGIYFIQFIAIIALIYSLVYISRNREIILTKLITPGFLIFVIFSFIVLITHKGRLISSWDEFSHWGLVVKNMYNLDSFGNVAEATTVFRGYPPAVSLLQYFFVRFNGPFIEANLFRASSFFILVLLLPIFKNIEWKKWSKIALLSIICFIIPTVFYTSWYSTIYVDCTLGVLFAYILYSYFSSDLNITTVISVALGLGIITLTKAAGTGLAIIALLIIVVDLLVFRLKQLKEFCLKLSNKIIIFMPIIMIIFSKYSWSTYLKITNTREAWFTSEITLSGIMELASGNAPRYRIITINNFFNSFFEFKDLGYVIKMSYLLWIVAIILLVTTLVGILSCEKEKNRFKIVGWGLTIGTIIYTASLLILYLFTYSEYEAQNLASFDRYMGTYFLGGLIFMIFMIITKNINEKLDNSGKINILILSFLLCFSNLNPLVNATILSKQSVNNTILIRDSYSKSLNFNLDPKKDRVYFISQNSSGLDYWITYYNITPVKMSEGFDWSLGEPYNEADIWSKNITVNEWADLLKEQYTHVYLYKIDERFKEQYGSLFENQENIKENSLYIVDKTSDKLILRLSD